MRNLAPGPVVASQILLLIYLVLHGYRCDFELSVYTPFPGLMNTTTKKLFVIAQNSFSFYSIVCF